MENAADERWVNAGHSFDKRIRVTARKQKKKLAKGDSSQCSEAATTNADAVTKPRKRNNQSLKRKERQPAHDSCEYRSHERRDCPARRKTFRKCSKA